MSSPVTLIITYNYNDRYLFSIGSMTNLTVLTLDMTSLIANSALVRICITAAAHDKYVVILSFDVIYTLQ